MKGTVLAVNFQSAEALISGDDEVRYPFAAADWKDEQQPQRGQRVDFEVAAGKAVAVYREVSQMRAGLGSAIGFGPAGDAPLELDLTGVPPQYQAEFQKIWESGESYKGKWNWAAFLL